MSDASPLPIIILGCPRSGTTLARRLINAHPNIHCDGESFLLRAAVRFLSGETVAEGIDYGPVGGLAALGVPSDALKDRLRRFVLQFHEELAAAAGKPRFAIKTAVDSFYVPEIVDLFKGHAQFVCIVRHGLDVAVSLRDFTQVMEAPIDELRPYINRHRRFMPAYAAAWAKITADILAAADQYPEDVLALRYEDLVNDPKAVLESLFEFLNEPCDVDDLLTRAFATADVHGLGDYKTFETKKIVSESVDRWHELPARIQAEVAGIVNPLLERLGYETIDASASATDGMRLHELAMMYKNTRAGE